MNKICQNYSNTEENDSKTSSSPIKINQQASQIVSDDGKKNFKPDSNSYLNFQNQLSLINATPDVDISNLVYNKEIFEKQKFESGINVATKKNHVTGHINDHVMNGFNFNEQYYNFHAYGFAQDPTDFTQNRIIGNVEKYNNPNSSKSVFTGTNQAEKEYRKKLKAKRLKYGDPATGEFMGPWATYEGEEIFKNMSGGELTEEQKEILRIMEEKRLKKIEDDQINEKKILNVICLNNV